MVVPQLPQPLSCFSDPVEAGGEHGRQAPESNLDGNFQISSLFGLESKLLVLIRSRQPHQVFLSSFRNQRR